MKKPKPERKAIREQKYERKLAVNASFTDVLKASAFAANKKTVKKVKKSK